MCSVEMKTAPTGVLSVPSVSPTWSHLIHTIHGPLALRDHVGADGLVGMADNKVRC